MSDLRGWGDLAATMCEHPHVCPEYRFARGIIAWWPALGEAMDQDNLRGRIIQKLHWLAPLFVGPRIVQCTTCRSVAFMNPAARVTIKTIRAVFDPRTEWLETILLVGSDVDAWGEDEYKERGLQRTEVDTP